MEAEERKAREKGRDTDDKDDNAAGIAQPMAVARIGVIGASTAHGREPPFRDQRTALPPKPTAQTIIDYLMKTNPKLRGDWQTCEGKRSGVRVCHDQ